LAFKNVYVPIGYVSTGLRGQKY